MTNCKNCGAPLVNGKCAYCRTEYGDNQDGITWYMDPMIINSKLFSLSLMTPNEARKLSGLKEI